MPRSLFFRPRATLAALALVAALAVPAPGWAQSPAHDGLDAVVWSQTSVEFKAASLSAYALATLRLDQALADKSWTAAPGEQSGNYGALPPAIILDIDETALDTSPFQAWLAIRDQVFDPKAWTAFVNDAICTAMPGALEFAKYAESKGVKVFYITGRVAEEEAGTRRNMEALGFPMGGNVDTFLMTREKPEWTSNKSSRRAHITKDYRVLLNVGDNFADFTDDSRGGIAERMKVLEAHKGLWGKQWIMIANPTYGSSLTAPFNHNHGLPAAAKRQAKRDSLNVWKGP